MTNDPVNHPSHYTSHPSGIETIEITEDMSFCIGNAWKYLARYDLKGKPLEDLQKTLFYIKREILRRKRGRSTAIWIRPRVAVVRCWLENEPKEWRRKAFQQLWLATGEFGVEALQDAYLDVAVHLDSARSGECEL